jgi:diaminopimelate decarboxylase
VAEAGILLVRVEYIKSSFGHLFACVNAGTFNSLPRPAIYPEARHEVVNASCVHSPELVPLTIAGHLCETGDVFAWQVKLPLPRAGDILAILQAGAYGQSMASTFNLRSLPREIYLS